MQHQQEQEFLTPQAAEEAAARVAAILSGGEANGTENESRLGSAAFVVPPSIAVPSPPPPPPVRSSLNHSLVQARRAQRTGKRTVTPSPAPAVDTNQRSLTITLPKDILAWYEQQAAQAPFEPSVQRFIAWELRQTALASQRKVAAVGYDDTPLNPATLS